MADTPDEARAKRIKRNRRMLESWRSGVSITEIAREHRLSLSWTGRLLRQEGAVLPQIRQGVRRADLPVAEIIREYDKGATMQALADKHGTSYGTIRRLLIKNKVRIRPHGGQNAIEISPLLRPTRRT
ncbi:helix-turn-helix domain-containing protein [Amycolatopsis benzoatilytica]|uniref:helix-turn-helix domain-containing protein n=1 Tax=Amycolatopsis benzoatilytica TaxID=346045 RepID=UPI00035D56F1|nr:helix-turn-helix domain-containing protein [Amycolatopsis benzoatilytica]